MEGIHMVVLNHHLQIRKNLEGMAVDLEESVLDWMKVEKEMRGSHSERCTQKERILY